MDLELRSVRPDEIDAFLQADSRAFGWQTVHKTIDL